MVRSQNLALQFKRELKLLASRRIKTQVDIGLPNRAANCGFDLGLLVELAEKQRLSRSFSSALETMVSMSPRSLAALLGFFAVGCVG